MKILGIDPGSRCAGFGIISIQEGTYRYLASGTIKTVVGTTLAKRIESLAFSIQEIIEHYQPDEVAMEEVFINVNAAASLMLGQARGALMAAVVLKKLPIYEYSALQVKKAVVGKGKARKEQVQLMVKQLLILSQAPSVDAADALATALTHIFQCHNSIISIARKGRQA